MKISREGISLVTFQPESTGEYEWLRDNVDAEAYQWLGHTLVIDTGYAGDLIDAAQTAGWAVELN